MLLSDSVVAMDSTTNRIWFMPMRYTVVTDANFSIGLGHVMRQFALAKRAKQKGFEPVFISHSNEVGKRCAEHDTPFVLAKSMEVIADQVLEIGADRLIIDVYERNFNVFRALCKYMPLSVVIVSKEYFSFTPFGSHLIYVGSDLDQWDNLQKSKHEGELTVIHSGRAWMIFREECHGQTNEDKLENNAVLIAHGGTDPYGLTARCLHALEYTKMTGSIYILVTSAFRNLAEIYQLSESSKHQCKVILDTNNVANWMRRSKVALINGGNMRYELCIAQTAFIALSINTNQYNCTSQLSRLGACLNLGVADDLSDVKIAASVDALLADEQHRCLMKNKMDGLFDLRGADRILELLKE